ncbi:MAG: hypothetical protein RLY93_00045 [Sumerlaeia bacterium]
MTVLSPTATPTADQVFHRAQRRHLIRYISLKLATMGLPSYHKASREFLEMTEELVRNHQEKNRQLAGQLCPADQRIQAFLDSHLKDVINEDGNSHGRPVTRPRLPWNTLTLDRVGLARELSLPVEGNHFRSELVDSYRVKNGVLHNPRHDRRTTKGVFHVAEGGLPIPLDKRAVPKATFARMLTKAFQAPAEMLRLPFLAEEEEQAEAWVSLLLRPLVCPEVPGASPHKTMETRFFAPGSLVCNLDFVESIFGNGGDPHLPENDAALDTDHWVGCTGCVILAPHLNHVTKKELGLPHISEATARQRREGMCWEHEAELYNDGSAFKCTCRTDEGLVVTLIADNYFGYCKKEVKTQIGYAANLIGGCEEEHAGGALVFPQYNWGDQFRSDSRVPPGFEFEAQANSYEGTLFTMRPEGYGVDMQFPDSVFYIPEDAEMDLGTQTVKWVHNGQEHALPIRKGHVYVHPSGYRVEMLKHQAAPSWRLVGTAPEATYCHKPCTVSGGGKSEISKSILDFVIYGPIFVGDYERDIRLVEEIIDKDYSDRFEEKIEKQEPSRRLLSSRRSVGSVIKLLTPSEEYTRDYNDWLRSIPDYIKAVVYIIKRFYREEWGTDWKSQFTADLVNGQPGHALKHQGRELVGQFLRIGFARNGGWRTFKMRQDFIAAAKVQMEDDITVSTVVPANLLATRDPEEVFECLKVAVNCENRLFQRPDEAINRGVDHQAEADIASEDNFLSNFEPLTTEDARHIRDEALGYSQYTRLMQELLASTADGPEGEFVVSSAHPRIVDGKPSKNPRYLQVRPDYINARDTYLADVSVRLNRRVPANQRLVHPVTAVLPGRRNNPVDVKAGIRPLAVYNPIHYQELPELFMDFICSLTGKSPSTTGAGSEGALTKGPFNAIHATADLNSALVSFILTGYAGFSTAAGYVGEEYRVDHDISLLVPEIWSRLAPHERQPEFLIKNRCLERIDDMEVNGETVHASRLGWRITENFCRLFLGRIFDSPDVVFDDRMLHPEKQNMEAFIDGVKNITEAQQRVAKNYLDDGSVAGAVPPIQALIHIMATGSWNGKTAHDPEVRQMFTREYLLKSDWYQERLLTKAHRDQELWARHVASLQNFLAMRSHAEVARRLEIQKRLETAKRQLDRVKSYDYLRSLVGTIGADPLYRG